jgi:methionyl-tRNA formyltransferase
VKVAFLGSPRGAVPTLEALLAGGHEVALVVTQPNRAAGRSRTPQATPVKEAALARGLGVLSPGSARSPELRETLVSLHLDAMIVVAYGKVLPRTVYEGPRFGAINVHFSLLPAYRGAAPVQWALARGETMTGVTTMQISERLDEGDVLLQREIEIRSDEHAPALLDRLAASGAALLVETLDRIVFEGLRGRAQDPSRASYAPALTPADGAVDCSLMRAREIEGRVRGFDPWPGAWVSKEGRRIRIVEASAPDGRRHETAPGTVLAFAEGAFSLACAEGTVLDVRSLQLEGRRPVTAAEARNGRQLGAGDALDPARPA